MRAIRDNADGFLGWKLSELHKLRCELYKIGCELHKIEHELHKLACELHKLNIKAEKPPRRMAFLLLTICSLLLFFI
ncbi:hypothetical protein B0X71_14785 [Planococcus lenghuensis]|uniref:Uncharacterized protein n=1 Tax=Planococcus lenghuensis TaxID=2213202 RepID=A0A1Q2L1A6_9BACL|nr:hypothetical protein B0X71_14785 [Planococcus lenghuensis]